jgi:hypothetical protein
LNRTRLVRGLLKGASMKARVLVGVVGALLVSWLSAAQSVADEQLAWADLASFRGVTSRNLGKTFDFTCPPLGESISPRTVYGGAGGVYAYSSGLCGAAVHAGKITKESGGTFTVLVGKPFDFVKGTTENGIVAADIGTQQASFTFPPPPRGWPHK